MVNRRAANGHPHHRQNSYQSSIRHSTLAPFHPHTQSELQERQVKHTAGAHARHSSCFIANWSQAQRAKPRSSHRNKSSAEGGLRTLRQACSQEIPGSAMCVQNLDDSRGLAIRITYRISLRSSSLWEPRHPLLKVVMSFWFRGHNPPS